MKAFLFDMDGVIIDSEPLHFDVDIETVAGLGAVIDQHGLEPYVGMTNPEMWKALREQFGFKPSVAEIIELQMNRKLAVLGASAYEPIDGIRELIDTLKEQGIPMAVASSSPRVFIEAVLNKFGLLEEFGCIVSGEEVPQGKPAPDVYLEAARQLGAVPDTCVVLEDSRNGLRAAKAAGMRAIGFRNPNSGDQDLSEADWIVERISEIRLGEL
ncbi:haloacid dehalogenase superfamily, subfamily IA, variant 3 with third motif having DD or ED/haloacid dehalogenase superfamily, subfamily IA, variant 1 with third motif having Dx(3-4)D or Dx(3-4)E [Paenibacillaceae bacterium GAS479]|nr:haloacid dehalogenase superfamily, subfamily IA, variant 3 with third motif having DD or ED/haloacid dehalogenase superfamily, subfamily IA, variant 1 with third motif having Dx(3-4)D or Dx(3-4)E [Paenibacillaceae bacterium GAS479]